jgi:signal transduction histidine kinase
LHDEFAQKLSALSAGAASIKTTAASECPKLVPEANHLLQTSMALLKSLQATLQSLRPPEIDDFGLAASLSALVSDQERRAGGKLKIALAIDGDLESLPSPSAAHVYRIVQEGLTNIGKHAKASRAQIDLRLRHDPGDGAAGPRRRLTLSIEDNGQGIIENGAREKGGGLGLIGMRERVMALGGQLDITQLSHRSFRIHAVIPFETPAGAMP